MLWSSMLKTYIFSNAGIYCGYSAFACTHITTSQRTGSDWPLLLRIVFFVLLSYKDPRQLLYIHCIAIVAKD